MFAEYNYPCFLLYRYDQQDIVGTILHNLLNCITCFSYFLLRNLTEVSL